MKFQHVWKKFFPTGFVEIQLLLLKVDTMTFWKHFKFFCLNFLQIFINSSSKLLEELIKCMRDTNKKTTNLGKKYLALLFSFLWATHILGKVLEEHKLLVDQHDNILVLSSSLFWPCVFIEWISLFYSITEWIHMRVFPETHIDHHFKTPVIYRTICLFIYYWTFVNAWRADPIFLETKWPSFLPAL